MLCTKLNTIYPAEYNLSAGYPADILSMIWIVNFIYVQSALMHLIFNKIKFNGQVKKEKNQVKNLNMWCQKVKSLLWNKFAGVKQCNIVA